MSGALPQYGQPHQSTKEITHAELAGMNGVRRETVTRWFGRAGRSARRDAWNEQRRRAKSKSEQSRAQAAGKQIHPSVKAFESEPFADIFEIEGRFSRPNKYQAATLRGTAKENERDTSTKAAEALAEKYGDKVFDKFAYVNGFAVVPGWLWHESLPDPIDCPCRHGQGILSLRTQQRASGPGARASARPGSYGETGPSTQEASGKDSRETGVSSRSNGPSVTAPTCTGVNAGQHTQTQPGDLPSGCIKCNGRGWLIPRQSCPCIDSGQPKDGCSRCNGSGECVQGLPDLGRLIATYYLWMGIDRTVPQILNGDGNTVRYSQAAGVFQQTQERTCQDLGIDPETLRKYNAKLAALQIIRIAPGDKYDASGNKLREGDGGKIASSDPDKILWMPTRILDREMCVAEYQRLRLALDRQRDTGWHAQADKLAAALLKEWEGREHSLGAYWNELRLRFAKAGIPKAVSDALIPYKGT